MKLRRFTPDGVAAVRETLPKIEETGDLSLAEALVENRDLTEDIPELSSVDLDPDRVFPTTYAFCEYFHSLMKDHKPLSYRTDVGFWTWLAMVYVKQLVKSTNDRIKVGDATRYIPNPLGYQDYYRHLLAGAYGIYAQYDLKGCAAVCKTLLWKPMDTYGDVYEQIASRQGMVQDPAIVSVLNDLYFDDKYQKLKPRSGGDYPGAARRLVVAIDQIGMTRDFFEKNDADEILNVLPKEFDVFNPKKQR